MRFVGLIVFAACWATTVAAADELRFVLTSAEENVEVDEFNLVGRVPAEVSSRWQITKQTLHGGKQEGVTLVRLDNGAITVVVVPTRGMSVLAVADSVTGERLFGWDSPVKEVVHPALIDLESRGGLGWLEGFNEWMVRCGLEFAGHPGTDKFVTNTGDTAEMELSLHGKVGNIPASEVEVVVETTAPYRVTLRGVVYERLFFGPKLKLVTELSLASGERSFEVTDEVTNEGSADQEYQIIYHANFGQPLLEDGAKVVVAAKDVTPMNAGAASAVDHFDVYEGPTPGFTEEVFLVQPLSDEEGRSMAVLQNAAGDRGASVEWSTDTLPYLTVWKNTVAEVDGYVTGIEPGSGFPFNRSVERQYGRVPTLAAGESRRFSLTFTALDDFVAVANAVAHVKAIQGEVPMALVREPPATDFGDE